MAGLVWQIAGALAQSADSPATNVPANDVPASPPAAAVDPNKELQSKLDQITSSNDGLAANIKELELLLSLNVCDPATKAKIETLLETAQDSAGTLVPLSGSTETDALQNGVDEATPQSQTASLPKAETAGMPLERTALVNQLNALTVFVLTDRSFGSGIVVGPHLVLTNRHVVEAAKSSEIAVMSKAAGFLFRGRIVATTQSSDFNAEDFALISVDGALPALVAQLAPKAQALENVVAAGYPGTVISNDQNFRNLLDGKMGDAPDIVLSRGIVNTVQNSATAVPVIVHTAQISPGSSGGPLVNACGQIVGINTFLKQGTGGEAGFAISADVMERFLTSHDVNLPVGPLCAAESP
jgi:S1-C subfamily serine protease